MTKTPRVSQIGKECVACGTCVPVCPKEAIQIRWGVSAHVDEEKCVGCGGHQHGGKGRCSVKSTRKKRWSDYLWIAELRTEYRQCNREGNVIRKEHFKRNG